MKKIIILLGIAIALVLSIKFKPRDYFPVPQGAAAYADCQTINGKDQAYLGFRLDSTTVVFSVIHELVHLEQIRDLVAKSSGGKREGYHEELDLWKKRLVA